MVRRKAEKLDINKDYRTYYNGMEGLRNSAVHIELTPFQEAEIERVKTDPVYFMETYCMIITRDYGLQPFKLYEYQKKAFNLIMDNRFTIFNWGRRLGKTTLFGGIATWLLVVSDYYLIGCFADKDDDAMTLIDIVQTMYSNLPLWMQRGITSWNAHTIELENGSMIRANATTRTSGRSRGYNFIYVDEVAHIKKTLFDPFWAAVSPTTSEGTTTRILFTSTPDGLNHFYKFYVDAENGNNDFKPMKVTWRQHPNRDEEWRKTELKKLNNDKRKFAQEHEGDFLGSARTLIDGETLKNLFKLKKEPEYVEFKFKNCYKFKKFYDPLPHHKYMITCDPAEGLGLDYTAINVIDVTNINTYEQVALFVDNNISVNETPYAIKELCGIYGGEPLVLGENNTCSEIYLTLTRDLDYPKVYRDREDRKVGIRLNESNRNIGLSMLRNIIESGKLKIYDYDTLYQFSRFVEINNKYQAEDDEHDDIIMSLNLFSYFISDKKRFKLWLADIDYMRYIIDSKQKNTDYANVVVLNDFIGIPDESNDRDFLPSDYDPWKEDESDGVGNNIINFYGD